MNPDHPARRFRVVAFLALAVLAVMVAWRFTCLPQESRGTESLAEVEHGMLNPLSLKTPDAPTSAMIAGTIPAAEVVLRPLPVASKTGSHEWTSEDATDPEVIEKIAHNPEEFIGLVEENERIKRRQLVYRDETGNDLVERARSNGEPIQRFTLPGLDGQEFEVELTDAAIEPSGRRGTFTGRLPGKPQSLVTLAFLEDREAFSISSPEDGVFLQGNPREPGEVIVVSYDPDKYLPLPCGGTVETHQ